MTFLFATPYPLSISHQITPWNAHMPSGSHMPAQKRCFLLDGYLCQAQYVSRRPHDEDSQQAGPSTQPPSSDRKSYGMYRETLPRDFDLDLDQYFSTSSYGGPLPPPDIPLGWNIIIRNGSYDEVFLIQSSMLFAQAYEELCEAMKQLSLEGEGDEEQQEAEVDEIRAALDRLSFVESCAHDDAGETTLVEWEDSDSEATVADDESWLTVCAEEATKRARAVKELQEEVGRAVRTLVPTKDIHADALHPVRSPPNPMGPWILAAMCKVGLECKACTTPPSYRTLVAPVYQNLIKRA